MEAPKLKLLKDIRSASFAMRCAAFTGDSGSTAMYSRILEDLITKARHRNISNNDLRVMAIDGALRAAMEYRRNTLVAEYQNELNKLDFNLNSEL